MDAEHALKRLMLVPAAVAAIVTAGIVMIIAGVTADSAGAWIAGLVIAFFGAVFGIPLSWLLMSERRAALRIAAIASKSERTPMNVLAETTGAGIDETRGRAAWCIRRGYLDGYVISDDDIVRADRLDPSQREHAATCPNCHASFLFRGDVGQCPYCGEYVEQDSRH